mmetsp:Transcript_4321/g.9121  ORF Transcript_4321/g.9121 Transcript_4321/m.9121 type:complete len:326 (-) Transcript_4321:2374-3351(-)
MQQRKTKAKILRPRQQRTVVEAKAAVKISSNDKDQPLFRDGAITKTMTQDRVEEKQPFNQTAQRNKPSFHLHTSSEFSSRRKCSWQDQERWPSAALAANVNSTLDPLVAEDSSLILKYALPWCCPWRRKHQMLLDDPGVNPNSQTHRLRAIVSQRLGEHHSGLPQHRQADWSNLSSRRDLRPIQFAACTDRLVETSRCRWPQHPLVPRKEIPVDSPFSRLLRRPRIQFHRDIVDCRVASTVQPLRATSPKTWPKLTKAWRLLRYKQMRPRVDSDRTSGLGSHGIDVLRWPRKIPTLREVSKRVAFCRSQTQEDWWISHHWIGVSP